MATLTYYQSLTIENRRRIIRTAPLTLRDPPLTGPRMTRECFFGIRWNDININQRLTPVSCPRSSCSDTENRHDCAQATKLRWSNNYMEECAKRRKLLYFSIRDQPDVVSIIRSHKNRVNHMAAAK